MNKIIKSVDSAVMNKIIKSVDSAVMNKIIKSVGPLPGSTSKGECSWLAVAVAVLPLGAKQNQKDATMYMPACQQPVGNTPVQRTRSNNPHPYPSTAGGWRLAVKCTTHI